jgi:signal transduction histidine kinase
MSDHREHLAKLLSLGVHEFRTPVAVVSGYLRMLLRHFGDTLTDQQRKLIEEAEKSCGSLTALIAEQSELAQIEDGRIRMRREPIPIFGLLKQVASSVHEAEDRGVVLSVHDEGLAAVVLGDRERLQSALASLLQAALRERAEAGVVVAACARVRSADGGESAVIAIADGDEAEHLAAGTSGAPPSTETFDQYRGGMGFKLPLAARIVEAHGGRVTSPVAARGRLSILLSLPLATEPENAA